MQVQRFRGTEQISVISGTDKYWGFVVLGEVLVVFPQRHILVSASLQVLVQVRSFCFAGFGAHMRRMLPRPHISVDGGPLVVRTWPSCDEQESHGMQIQRTLVLKNESPGWFPAMRDLSFQQLHRPVSELTEATQKVA